MPERNDNEARRRFRFTRSMRLTQDLEYKAVFRQGLRAYVGPLVVYCIPNELGHERLGLSISRKVGNAVKRNGIKRRLREAFRYAAGSLPSGYDFVINVRAHQTLTLAEYQRLWSKASQQLHQKWMKQNHGNDGSES